MVTPAHNTAAHTSEIRYNICNLIPSFPDDPKSRFLDEIALDDTAGLGENTLLSGGKSSPRKKGNNSKENDKDSKSAGRALNSAKHSKQAREEQDRQMAEKALSKVSSGEFWERMGFRGECISGDVTGFFSLVVDGDVRVDSQRERTDAGRGGDGDEEKERSNSFAGAERDTTRDAGTDQPASTEVRLHPDSTLTPQIVDRLLSALLNVDFHSLETALDATDLWLASVRAIVTDELGSVGLGGCVGTVEAKSEEELKRRFPERESGDADTGVIGDKKREGEGAVTVLQARKKKRV